MPKEGDFKPIQYVCPICGEKTTFGAHFCGGEAKEAKRRPSLPAAGIGAASVALILIAALVWTQGGRIGLYALAALVLCALLFFAARRLPFGRSASEYRELVGMAGGDEAAVERLIALERMKRPGLPRSDYVREVKRQWVRDLR
jgi:hypothetical protein